MTVMKRLTKTMTDSDPQEIFVLLIVFAGLIGIPFAIPFLLSMRIVRRVGYSRLWALLFLVPLINVVMIWRFGSRNWPALRGNRPPISVAEGDLPDKKLCGIRGWLFLPSIGLIFFLSACNLRR